MEGRVIIPRLGIAADVSFLVDTGADSSLIAPADGDEMGLSYARLGAIEESLGTAGIARNYKERASLVFIDPGKELYIYHVELAIAFPHPDIEQMPSLLGREILN